MKKPTVMYVDNMRFLKLLTEHDEGVKNAKTLHQPAPRMSNELGDILIKIATNMARRPNFNGYPFKEEMIGDAILNSLQAVKSFNVEKGTNPFGYFSRIVYFCFIRRISSEKAELALKKSLMWDTETYEDDGDHYISKDESYLFWNPVEHRYDGEEESGSSNKAETVADDNS